MKNHKCRWALIIGIISAVAALSAALTAFFIVIRISRKKMTRSLWNTSTAQLSNY